MRILVDGDSCPIISQIEKVAKEKGCKCMIFHDINHEIHSDYSEVREVPKGTNSVDYAIVTECKKGDIVITNDAGLAFMVFDKAANVLSFRGYLYTEETIDEHMFRSHVGRICKRRGNYKGMPKVKKRKKTNSAYFLRSLEKCVS